MTYKILHIPTALYVCGAFTGCGWVRFNNTESVARLKEILDKCSHYGVYYDEKGELKNIIISEARFVTRPDVKITNKLEFEIVEVDDV